ncbi:hypothetical protein ACJQWK_04377 [Exserohilum turcicum]|uniref:Kinesin light chain n=1 Tax=Exserohilum turcicum (strain 28A) TaxID=671987 RepID=R0JZ05_EXST2|nr:uncharacterized protein SETTUDRAFT_34215 [Exserohilum turcica Et28A]EOA82674.1 hypothetical protein SETTUDRAFT_34215 [Exserohilum turcica Et28A]
MYESALEGYKNTFGPEQLDTLRTMDDFAGVLVNQRNYKEAEALFRQLLAGHEKALGNEHPDTLRCAQNLTQILKRMLRNRNKDSDEKDAGQEDVKTMKRGREVTDEAYEVPKKRKV